MKAGCWHPDENLNEFVNFSFLGFLRVTCNLMGSNY